MKSQAQSWVPALLLLAFALPVSAQTTVPDYILNTFDTASEISGPEGWARWWGNAPQIYEHDATVDADGNPNSGSLKATIQFDRALYTNDNQFAVLRQFPVTNGALYTNLVFDIRWDPSSPLRMPLRTPSDHGTLDFGFRVGNWSQGWVRLGYTIPTHGNWIHVVAPISPTLNEIGTASGIVLKMWAGNTDNDLTGTATFWIDNVKLIAITNDTPVPPPTLSLQRPEPGLNLLASHSTEIYQRQGIRTVSTANSWMHQFDPVTYAITISKYPDAAHNNFQTHMFLALANHVTNPNDVYVDYNAPHIMFWQIKNNSSGGAYANFMVKTNQPGNNTQFWGVGHLAFVNSSTPLGRWALTFNANNDVSMTAPDGSVTNFTIPTETLEFFTDGSQNPPLYAWFGVQPEGAGNIGQHAIISRIEIIREFDSTDDRFTEPTLNLSRWAVSALSPPGVTSVPPNATGWLSWTLPDVNFRLQHTEDLSSWGNTTTVLPAQFLDQKRLLLTPANFPLTKAFFRLEKPAP